jgi:hypothetical protein
MEPKRSEADNASEVAETQHVVAGAKQPEFTPPFASEGLERLRDSHC